MDTKVCQSCDKEFFSKTKHNRKYCSIGCRQVGFRKLSPEKYILSQIKARAKVRDYEFNLDLVDIIIPDYCPILGLKLKYHSRERTGFFPDSPSVDRINNDRGYIKGNVRVISNQANKLKSDATIEQLELVLADLKCHAG